MTLLLVSQKGPYRPQLYSRRYDRLWGMLFFFSFFFYLIQVRLKGDWSWMNNEVRARTRKTKFLFLFNSSNKSLWLWWVVLMMISSFSYVWWIARDSLKMDTPHLCQQWESPSSRPVLRLDGLGDLKEGLLLPFLFWLTTLENSLGRLTKDHFQWVNNVLKKQL